MSIDFKYEDLQMVFILALKMQGRVIGAMIENGKASYRVLYWWDGSRRQEWLYEHEIQPL